MSNVIIKGSIEDIKKDIVSTHDPIKRTILMKFLDIKINENIKSSKFHKRKREYDPEMEKILKIQNHGLSELDRISKLKAYDDILNDDKIEKDRIYIENTRGKNEKNWNTRDLYDPKYAKYIKEDSVNNKLMERLNSEIVFRLEDHKKMALEKPFDDIINDDETDVFARYNSSKIK